MFEAGWGWEENGISGLSARTAGVAEKPTRGLRPRDGAGRGLVSDTEIKMKVDVAGTGREGTRRVRSGGPSVWSEGARAGGSPRISVHRKQWPGD